MVSDPVALFAAITDALRQEDWAAAARLCDPASLASFRRQLLEQFQLVEPPRELTVEQYLLHGPEMPREVAEYHVTQLNRQQDPALRLARELPGVRSVAELQALSSVELFSLWLRGRSPRSQLEQYVTRGQVTELVAQQILDVAGDAFGFGYTALGAVPDGERLAHIVFRQEVHTEPETDLDPGAASRLAGLSPEEQTLAQDVAHRLHPQVVTCRRQQDGSWRALADHNFFGLGNIVLGVGLDESASFAPEGAE